MVQRIGKKPSVIRPLDWQIVIENVPAMAPVIGKEKEYWGFSIFRGPEEGSKALGHGSADDLITCMYMAAEMLEICQKTM